MTLGNMNQPKYQIGDRFTVMDTVQFEIVDIANGQEIRYIFQLFDNPTFRSIVTEDNLNDILAAQKTRRVLGKKILT